MSSPLAPVARPAGVAATTTAAKTTAAAATEAPASADRAEKARLRLEMKRRLEAIDLGGRRHRATERVHERVLCHPAVASPTGAAGVLTCLSFGAELDTWRLVERLRDAGRAVYVPRAEPRDRRLHVHPYPCPLHRLSFGLRQPSRRAPELAADDVAAHIGVVLVLGLAFDPRCRRLGYGGGYFDRFLDREGGTGAGLVALGLAFDEQIVDRLPAEAHDVAMSAVITPSAVFAPSDPPAGGAA